MDRQGPAQVNDNTGCNKSKFDELCVVEKGKVVRVGFNWYIFSCPTTCHTPYAIKSYDSIDNYER